jgi:hypothetical protein
MCCFSHLDSIYLIKHRLGGNMKYWYRTYNMDRLKSHEIRILQEALYDIGFYEDTDYRIVYFGNSAEMKVTNKELHSILKAFTKLRRYKKCQEKKQAKQAR